jgi:hypothetical protein
MEIGMLIVCDQHAKAAFQGDGLGSLALRGRQGDTAKQESQYGQDKNFTCHYTINPFVFDFFLDLE